MKKYIGEKHNNYIMMNYLLILYLNINIYFT